MNVPLLLTWLRLLAIPIFGVVYFLPFSWAHPLASIIFLLAALTDWLDGYLARSLSQTTDFGAFLDPVVDKLMVAVALMFVVGEQYLAYLSIPAAIIVGREIAISALREWMAEVGKRASVAVTLISKIKTTLQMLALVLLLWYAPGQLFGLLWAGVIALYAAALLTLWTMIVYLKVAWPDLTLPRDKQ
ncbi:MAG: CDP-diacylglycerol--glycerol-3-phosphate 3-phosphatidyltransferase [Coxiella sp. RIFCSPHIGHO2_12_FULL_44_14]|nr:MAG: CDP-diacylglycerol--glycerol-3-phosphate 3-phosphatidyltransferase [Coxiella sp. RIFCSPHIGHO2_12_FULL_44_14]